MVYTKLFDVYINIIYIYDVLRLLRQFCIKMNETINVYSGLNLQFDLFVFMRNDETEST